MICELFSQKFLSSDFRVEHHFSVLGRADLGLKSSPDFRPLFAKQDGGLSQIYYNANQVQSERLSLVKLVPQLILSP